MDIENIMEIKISTTPVEYSKAMEEMQKRHAQVLNNEADELIWFLEHEHVYTAGISANDADLLTNDIPVFKTTRGGKFTYHGNGQQVCYFVVDLKRRSHTMPDVRCFVSCLEDIIINSLAKIGIIGEKRKDRIGVWVKNGKTEQKIAAIGVKFSKGVTMHGFAVNVKPDLTKFNGIVPCGISDFGVCSVESLGFYTSIEEFREILVQEVRNMEKLGFYQNKHYNSECKI